MAEDLTKKAAEMLLGGATLLSHPCPYCSGVRVMMQGHALCVSCGMEPEKRQIPKEIPKYDGSKVIKALGIKLEENLEALTNELKHEKDLEKQQLVLKSINLVLEALEKIKDKQ